MEDIVLFQSSEYSESDLKSLLGETIGCGVIDSGCSRTVTGRQWIESFKYTLGYDSLTSIKEQKSHCSFKFGKGPPLISQGQAKIPVVIGTKKVFLETDIVDADIPLLLSKDSLKRAGTILDFNNDTSIMLGETQSLVSTESGHYAIPVTMTRQENRFESKVILIGKVHSQQTDCIKVANKLHRQFCHCSAEKLKRLVKTAKLMDDEKEILSAMDKVSTECKICKVYKRAPAVPVVTLPLATEFNETVAMDLITIEQGNGFYILLTCLRDIQLRVSASPRKKNISLTQL